MFDIFHLTDLGTFSAYLPQSKRADSIEDAMRLSRTRYFWIINYLCHYEGWDWIWEPPPWESHQRHAWASQCQRDCGTYLIPKSGYTDTHYHESPRIITATNMSWWKNKDGNPSIPLFWHPDYRDPPYIYQFGTQHQPTGGPKYEMDGATEVKYCDAVTFDKKDVDYENWHIPELDEDFDFTWHPDDRDPPYIYQFGTQHQPTGGPRYVVNGASEIKYVRTQITKKTSIDANWEIPDGIGDFDFTWHPDDRDPPYIYQFGTQWNRGSGPRYIMDGATEIKYVATQIAKMLPTDTNWSIPHDIEIKSFDFSWSPDSTEIPYIYQFGTQHQKTGGPRYIVQGATEVKYVSDIRARKTSVDDNWKIPDGIGDFDFTWHPDSTEIPYIYQFGTQWQKTGGPIYTVKGASEIKYVSDIRAEKTSVDDNWEIPEGVDEDSFDFTWHPDSTEIPYIYQFGTQHQKTGGPRYIVQGATEIKYVDQIRMKSVRFANAIYEIDHMNGLSGQIPDTFKVVRYFDNYLDTLRRIANNAPRDQEYIWVCSSVCDYSDFDFSWHPEQWQSSMLHVFASDEQKFGDTFFMHVPTFQYRSEKCKLLDWYDINFVEKSVPRHPLPIIRHDNDTHVDVVKNKTWKGPLAIFTVEDNISTVPTVPLWREETKTVVPISTGASSVIVPNIAIPYIKTQIYDYPHVDKTCYKLQKSHPLDIIFLSNKESNADENWNHLLSVVPTGRRIVRVDGVNGRVASQHASAHASATKWYYVVPAKLKVDPSFDWDWQPDRLQQPKHYIFHAHNPVNDLVYGHMAMVAYNKELVLDTSGNGLDFTLEKEHEVVPILSGTAEYAHDSIMAWRTAFRECIKLYLTSDNIENRYRLKKWTTVDNTAEQWSLKGALDAVEYMENSGDPTKSYEWDWLHDFWTKKYR